MPKFKETHILDQRIFVTYYIAGDEKSARAVAEDICFEQTVEFPQDLISSEFIRNQVVGRIEDFNPCSGGGFKAVISYAQENAAGELTQLINLIFGNISIKQGIRVCDFVLPKSLLELFRGPRFGRRGLRELLGVWGRPLLCTALKPLGLSAHELADLAYQCAQGGIDIIKDDHGLTNQCFASFEERISLCSQAVNKANKKTGGKCVYTANITAPFNFIQERAKFAKDAGAGALIAAPGIIGFDTMRAIACDDSLGLPVFSHPAFLGAYLINPAQGISHYALLGLLNRLSGADAVVYPNYGGRFPFSRQDCEEIVRGVGVNIGNIKEVFPMPGGGMSLKRIPELLEVYGSDVIFLIGGDLFRHSPDLAANCRYFKKLIS